MYPSSHNEQYAKSQPNVNMQYDSNSITYNTPTYMNLPLSQPTASQLTNPPQAILYANQPQGNTPAPNSVHPHSTEEQWQTAKKSQKNRRPGTTERGQTKLLTRRKYTHYQ
jgi:hypothetical protein